jgi:hypothetical protein
MPTASVRLELVDVRNKGISDHTLIELRSLDSSDRYRNNVFVERTIELGGIAAQPAARYEITLWPSDYRPVRFFLTVREGEVATREPVIFPVNPDRVNGIVAPKWSTLDSDLRRVLEHSALDTHKEMGEALYDAIDDLRKACLLNIFAKGSATPLLDGSTCFDHIQGLVRLRADRFFARTDAALREEVQNDRNTFRRVSEKLHHQPDGYVPAGSYKTREAYGNLQFTFFRQGETGDHYLVDVDIDEAAGIEHAFEVLRNQLGDRSTHPFDVREILIRHQRVDPGYDFQFAPEAVITATVGA